MFRFSGSGSVYCSSIHYVELAGPYQQRPGDYVETGAVAGGGGMGVGTLGEASAFYYL